MSITSTNRATWEEGLEPFDATPQNKRILQWFRDYLMSNDSTLNGLLGKLRTKLADQGPVGDEKSWTNAQLKWIWMALHRDKIQSSKLAPLDFFFKRVSAFLSPCRKKCSLPFEPRNEYRLFGMEGLRPTQIVKLFQLTRRGLKLETSISKKGFRRTGSRWNTGCILLI
jgi:hypothetical protein